MSKPKIQTNLDTNLLKLIAIISMTIDHIGYIFFPENPIFRWIGRLAFPIFCYCLTVGLIYTRDMKKYLLRLLIFAIISQPLYALAFNFNILSEPNIFFTLFISLLSVYNLINKKYWIFILGFITLLFLPFDYNTTGIFFMLIFYYFKNKPQTCKLFYVIYCILISLFSPFMIFALLAFPLFFIITSSKLKISKWFFYVFYPLHLLILFVCRILVGV